MNANRIRGCNFEHPLFFHRQVIVLVYTLRVYMVEYESSKMEDKNLGKIGVPITTSLK